MSFVEDLAKGLDVAITNNPELLPFIALGMAVVGFIGLIYFLFFYTREE